VNQDQWDDQIDEARDVLSDLRQLAGGSVPSKQASAAIQQVDAMIGAMKRGDRKTAAAYGRAALALL
jgi:hypothetical protein